MLQQDPTPSYARRHPRLKLPAMYTLIRVRESSEKRFRQAGYVYDISESGARFELDNAITPGTDIQVRVTLPGSQRTTFNAVGHVVRMHDDEDEPGPRRLAMTFDRFTTDDDHSRLSSYLVDHGVVAA